jgi:putative ABC transport system permease protein
MESVDGGSHRGASVVSVRLTYRYLIAGACRQLWRYRLRSLLTIACAALGVAGVITSVDYASGGRQQVLAQIRRMGTNIVIVSAQQSRATAGRARTGAIVTTLRDSDYDALRRDLVASVRSSAVVSRPLRLKAEGLSKISPIIGCEPAYFAIKSWPIADGGLFDAADVRRIARVAVLGSNVAAELYGAKSPVGKRLFIDRVPFDVAGVLAERGQGLDVANEDEQVYVPLTTAMHRLLSVDYFNALLFEIGGWDEMDRSAAVMSDVLNLRHHTGRRPADFQVQNQKELVDTQLASSEKLGFLVRWIGVSGLAVSGLGVLAIAWITVKDRTTEIGVRRALGARASDVFVQFSFEAFTTAALGSIAGLGFGWAGSRIAATMAQLPFVFDRPAAGIALLMALGLNLLFAVWPAIRAAKLNPISALKFE